LDPSDTKPNRNDDDIVIDASDCTLMPGLIDAHIHAHDMCLPAGFNADDILKQALRCGVTTVCYMRTEPSLWMELEQYVRRCGVSPIEALFNRHAM
jgi:dihydroorotase-like cyclic amidohydrolase